MTRPLGPLEGTAVPPSRVACAASKRILRGIHAIATTTTVLECRLQLLLQPPHASAGASQALGPNPALVKDTSRHPTTDGNRAPLALCCARVPFAVTPPMSYCGGNGISSSDTMSEAARVLTTDSRPFVDGATLCRTTVDDLDPVVGCTAGIELVTFSTLNISNCGAVKSAPGRASRGMFSSEVETTSLPCGDSPGLHQVTPGPSGVQLLQRRPLQLRSGVSAGPRQVHSRVAIAGHRSAGRPGLHPERLWGEVTAPVGRW